LHLEDASRGASAASTTECEHRRRAAGIPVDGGKNGEGSMSHPGDGPIAEKPAPIVTQKQKHEIHQLACNLKGAYIRVLKLCKELDIPFSS
jgi:hypothetical protein